MGVFLTVFCVGFEFFYYLPRRSFKRKIAVQKERPFCKAKPTPIPTML